MTMTILPTRNEEWGFWGTISRIENDAAADPAEAWRDFLDSRHGRHFADEVASEFWKGEALNDAIDAAINRWMGWRIDRKTSRETGIPRGLPYLTGFANHYAIMAELPY
jgi:hypothetical protein